MCCKSWKTFFPFCVTFLLGVLAAIPFQTLRTELKFREVRDNLASAHGNGIGFGSRERHSCSFDSKKSLQVLAKPRAVYTDAARTNQTEGTVTLRVAFLENGKIGDVSIVNYLPDGLTEQAIEAAKQIKFEPAMLNGKPITVTKQVQYNFTLY